MVAPSIKVPNVTNATKNSIVFDPGTLVFNSDDNVIEYVDSTGHYASINNVSTNLSEVIYLDAVNGNDSNTGSIISPLKTYEAARLLAVSRTPFYASTQTIMVMSSINLPGDMTLSPFVNIVGTGQYSSTMGVPGNIVLDPSWGTKIIPTCQIIGIDFVANSINLVYPSFQSDSFIRIQNCILQMVGDIPSVNITGAGNGPGGECENVIFESCNLDLYPSNTPEPIYTTDNVNIYFFNTNPSNDVNISVSSATSKARCIIQDTQFELGNLTLTATSTGTLETDIGAANTRGKTLTINGASNTVIIDSTSYQFSSLVLSGGATLSNITLPTLTDGMTNSSYTPSRYTPTGGTNFISDSLTGNLKGIDNSLPKASGSATLVGGTVTVSSSSVASGDSIDLTCTSAGGAQGFITVTYNPGVSFTLTSSSALDTSTYKWKNLGA